MIKITIGARGSKLSLAYVEKVKELLLQENKELKDKNIINIDKVYEDRAYVLDNLNKFFTFNLSQNSLINAINIKLNNG